MLILDGYSRRFTRDDLHIIYRPATVDERKELRRSMKLVDDDTAESIAAWWMSKKIQFWSRGECNRQILKFMYLHERDLFCELFLVLQGLIADDSGEVWCKVDKEWQKNLAEGALLENSFPMIAKRSCDHCQKYWYSDKTGKPIVVNSTGELMLRSGPTPCRVPDIGCPKGTPEDQRSLSIENKWALSHFRGCDAIGSGPDCEIVKRNARIIRKALSK